MAPQKLNPLFVLSFAFLLLGCKTTATINPEANAQKNPTARVVRGNRDSSDTTKILILGNSITHHGPLESIGWKGDWGMAASKAEKDFVHVLVDTLKKYNPTKILDYNALNIAYWEQDFNYDFSSQKLVSYKPDILVIRLGENVKEEYGKENNYSAALDKLIDTFKGPKTRVIVTGNFWPSTFKDGAQKQVAVDNGYTFIDLSDLSLNDKNKALGQFENGGVAHHPSDFGMYNIAMKIFNTIVAQKWF